MNLNSKTKTKTKKEGKKATEIFKNMYKNQNQNFQTPSEHHPPNPFPFFNLRSPQLTERHLRNEKRDKKLRALLPVPFRNLFPFFLPQISTEQGCKGGGREGTY